MLTIKEGLVFQFWTNTEQESIFRYYNNKIMNATLDQTSKNNVNSNSNRKVILAGLIGNVMEWFDFAVYGYFASIIGTHFFPS